MICRRGVHGSDDGNAVGITHWRTAQQESAHEAEHRCVNGNAQRQREHSDDGEAGTPAKRAPGEAHIFDQGLQPGKASVPTISFFRLLQTAQLHERLPSSLLWTHARANVVLDVHCEMAVHLGVEIAVVALTSEERGQANKETAQRLHQVASWRSFEKSFIAQRHY